MLGSARASILFAGRLFPSEAVAMSRAPLAACCLLTPILLAPLLAARAAAQAWVRPPAQSAKFDVIVEESGRRQRAERSLVELSTSPELARAKLEAMHADAGKLARQKLEAARDIYRAHLEEFLAGHETFDTLEADALRLVELELAVHARPADQAAILERGWEWAWSMNKINERRFLKGRVPLADYFQKTSDCLEMEIR
jgi:hypothetical protein